jgi:hypothetical protein
MVGALLLLALLCSWRMPRALQPRLDSALFCIDILISSSISSRERGRYDRVTICTGGSSRSGIPRCCCTLVVLLPLLLGGRSHACIECRGGKSSEVGCAWHLVSTRRIRCFWTSTTTSSSSSSNAEGNINLLLLQLLLQKRQLVLRSICHEREHRSCTKPRQQACQSLHNQLLLLLLLLQSIWIQAKSRSSSGSRHCRTTLHCSQRSCC